MEEELLNLFVPSTGASCLPGIVGGAGETAVDGTAWFLPLHRFSSGMQPSLYYHSACNPEPFGFLLLVCFPICKMRTWRKSGWLPGLTLLWLLPWIPWFVLRSIKAAPCSMPRALAGMMLSQNWPWIFAKATHDWNSKAGLRPDSQQPDQERDSTFHRGKKKMRTTRKWKPGSLETCWASLWSQWSRWSPHSLEAGFSHLPRLWGIWKNQFLFSALNTKSLSQPSDPVT